MKHRIAVDTGGTFTDVVVANQDGALTVGKAPSTPERSSGGVIEGLKDAARNMSLDLDSLIASTDVLIYGTTWATNAIITGSTAKTAILLTEGFPDILVYRQGGKLHPFELQIDPLKPYVPRRLTVEVPERINAEGGIERALDESAVRDELRRLAGQQVEAGQDLAVVEAMKMENVLRAQRTATVAEVMAEKGDNPSVDQPILRFD